MINSTATMAARARTLACALAFGAGSVEAADTISGTVHNGAKGAEAGVWVIAQTNDTPTPYRKIVVTDDAGKFVLPELPAAKYKVWVRGYGLADSNPVEAQPGADLTLTVAVASDAAEAALVYPANTWLSLFEPPPASAFGGDGGGSAGGGLFAGAAQADTKDPFKTPGAWFAQMKLNCVLCHQVGSMPTRLGAAAGFDHGLRKAAGMNYFADALGRTRLSASLGAWGDRLGRGEVPDAPPRPQGIERNLVITQWEWGDGYTYAHDEIATDKRDPTVNANGPVYGVDLENDYLLVLDPQTHTAERLKVPTRNGFKTPWGSQTYKALDSDKQTPFGFGSLGDAAADGQPSVKGVYQNPANPHNPMMDAAGRVWMTTQIRRQWAEDTPAWCRDDAVIMNNHHHRQLGYYDPSNKSWQLFDTCYGTHHLQFDADGVLWTSGDDFVVGSFDVRKFDAKNPASEAQANRHSEVRVDSDGDGKPDQAIVGFHYGVIANPKDKSVWSAVPPGVSSPPGTPGWLLRYDPASDRHEAYEPPAPGVGPRGVDVDTQGRIWTALAGSGQLAMFDRARCKQTWGTGAQCAEGWSVWEVPGPRVRALAADGPLANADMFYYLWVDQFDTLGLGKDTVIINGTNSDALIAFVPATQKFVTLRIPYPLNSYTRGLDGRIDDTKLGWKGRGLWYTNGLDPLIHSEVQRSYVAKVQLRPHPLAH